MQDSILGVIDLPLREAPEGAKNLPFAKGMPMMVVYITILGLILFPFGASASSIREQGFDPGMPLEEMYLASLILIGLSILLLFFYRDPYREIQDGIVSPADGLVQKVDKHSGMIQSMARSCPRNTWMVAIYQPSQKIQIRMRDWSLN